MLAPPCASCCRQSEAQLRRFISLNASNNTLVRQSSPTIRSNSSFAPRGGSVRERLHCSESHSISAPIRYAGTPRLISEQPSKRASTIPEEFALCSMTQKVILTGTSAGGIFAGFVNLSFHLQTVERIC